MLSILNEKRCGYCSHHLSAAGSSLWDGKEDSHHYKQANCSQCGKHNWLKVEYHGSGHDVSAHGKTIESIIRKVAEK